MAYGTIRRSCGAGGTCIPKVVGRLESPSSGVRPPITIDHTCFACRPLTFVRLAIVATTLGTFGSMQHSVLSDAGWPRAVTHPRLPVTVRVRIAAHPPIRTWSLNHPAPTSGD